MATRSRIRKRIDVGRLREAMAAPGADPRTWLLLARIDADEDALRFEADLGWIVDVTVVGGELDGEGPIACRLVLPYSGDGVARIDPPEAGTLVVVGLVGGNANEQPIILGRLTTPDLPVPSEVNGESIDESLAAATHLFVTERNVEQQAGESWVAAAATDAKLLASNVELAEDGATQEYVRGGDYADALDTFLDALDTFVFTLSSAPPAPPNAALTVAAVLAAANVFRPQLAQFKSARGSYLSTRIKGE